MELGRDHVAGRHAMLLHQPEEALGVEAPVDDDGVAEVEEAHRMSARSRVVERRADQVDAVLRVRAVPPDERLQARLDQDLGRDRGDAGADPLRVAGRAGRVAHHDPGHPVGHVGRGKVAVKRLVRRPPAGPASDDEEVFRERLHLELRHLVRVGDDDPGAAVLEDEGDLARCKMPVDGDQKHPDLGRRKTELDILGAVVHHHCDDVAARQSKGTDAVGEGVDPLEQLPERGRRLTRQDEGRLVRVQTRELVEATRCAARGRDLLDLRRCRHRHSLRSPQP